MKRNLTKLFAIFITLIVITGCGKNSSEPDVTPEEIVEETEEEVEEETEEEMEEEMEEEVVEPEEVEESTLEDHAETDAIDYSGLNRENAMDGSREYLTIEYTNPNLRTEKIIYDEKNNVTLNTTEYIAGENEKYTTGFFWIGPSELGTSARTVDANNGGIELSDKDETMELYFEYHADFDEQTGSAVIQRAEAGMDEELKEFFYGQYMILHKSDGYDKDSLEYDIREDGFDVYIFETYENGGSWRRLIGDFKTHRFYYVHTQIYDIDKCKLSYDTMRVIVESVRVLSDDEITYEG